MNSLVDQLNFALNVLGQMKSSQKSSVRSIELQSDIVATLARCQMLKEAGDEVVAQLATARMEDAGSRIAGLEVVA